MTDMLTDTEFCITCEYPVNTDGTEDVYWANIAEGWQCLGCRESSEAHAARIIHFRPDGDDLVALWADEFAIDMAYGEDIDLAEEYPGLAQAWHSTDAWRGYTTITTPKGWEPVDGGCALWGEDTAVSDQYRAITAAADAGELDAEYLIVVAPTSNVFSQTIDIFKREEVA